MRLRRELLIALAALALAAPLAAPRLPAAQAQSLATGVSLYTGGAHVPDDDPSAYGQVKAAGARYVHASAFWDGVAPTKLPAHWDPENPADPNYRWSSVDAFVTRSVAAGLTPVLLVDGAPAWAQRCGPARVCDPNPALLAQFATAIARRYSGHFQGLPRVRYWEGLNEPNLSLFFNPQFVNGKPASPTLYRALINSFYAAIKAVDPSNLVLAAGLGPIGVPGYTIPPLQFARLLLCMKGRSNPRPTPGNCDGGVHFDIFGIHPYTTGGPTHKGRADDVELGDLEKLQTLLAAADKAGRIKGKYHRTPLWITEFSWDSKPPDPGGLAMAIDARWTAEALYQAWSAGVSNFFWFSLRDQATDGLPFSQTLQSGLYFQGPTPAQAKPKKVMYAFRFPFVAYRRGNGIFFWGRTPTSKGGGVSIQVQEGGRWSTVARARADGSGIFTGTVATGFGRGGSGYVRAVSAGQAAVPFSLREVADFMQPPFG